RFYTASAESKEDISSRISGGQATTIDAFPFSTALLTNRGTGDFTQACGGTILTTSAILTAASCFHTAGTLHPAAWWRARVGSTYAASGGIVHLIRLITRHPDFNHITLNSDIAVLRTTVNLVMVPNAVQAAFIAGGAYSLANNQPVVAIGWGGTSAATASSNVLRQVQMWVTDQQTCVNRYSPLGITVTPNMLCAGWLDVGIRGQCLGDTGSPLLHNGVVVGVYSWTEGCGLGRYPNINTRLPVFSRWVVATAIAA
ncbi:trypsin, alkaline A-like, partial [Epargyreus clarus]|uniref:trypsin, alkaline A-like n=1 Tax=Epargyreus clarus TaxID=520877 RepID=UPI003C3066FF